jgi:hypothetical protein
MAPTTRQIGTQALFFFVIVILFFAAPIAAVCGNGGSVSLQEKLCGFCGGGFLPALENKL